MRFFLQVESREVEDNLFRKRRVLSQCPGRNHTEDHHLVWSDENMVIQIQGAILVGHIQGILLNVTMTMTRECISFICKRRKTARPAMFTSSDGSGR